MPYLDIIFKYKGYNFIENKFYNFITKTSLEKIFAGKITNTKLLLKHYLKSIRVDCSYSKLYKLIKDNKCDKHLFYNLAKNSLNANHLIDFINSKKLEDYHIFDINKEASILGKKINYKWSEKRFQLEHKINTKTIMDVEVKYLQDIEYNYPCLIKKYDGIKLIRNNKELFKEGKIMNHCIYSSYGKSIESKHYVAFHIDYNGEEATTMWGVNDLKIIQTYGYGNSKCSNELIEYVTKFFEDNKLFLEKIKKEQTVVKTNNFDFENFNFEDFLINV